ncbi:hypothetical protein [Halomontanus rarus]|uniref:hypothetical protein n=1 Tax=Halomontanus rarus TaxID=3034020 RepID=UPI00307BB965
MIQFQTSEVVSIDRDSTGEYVAYASPDRVHVHTLVDGEWKEEVSFPRGTSEIVSLAFGGDMIAFAEQNGTIHIHETTGSWQEEHSHSLDKPITDQDHLEVIASLY